jgi:hypothetical protein
MRLLRLSTCREDFLLISIFIFIFVAGAYRFFTLTPRRAFTSIGQRMR